MFDTYIPRYASIKEMKPTLGQTETGVTHRVERMSQYGHYYEYILVTLFLDLLGKLPVRTSQRTFQVRALFYITVIRENFIALTIIAVSMRYAKRILTRTCKFVSVNTRYGWIVNGLLLFVNNNVNNN